MAVDFDDFEYATPGERLGVANAGAYDLRTGPELMAARIAALEARLRHVEVLLHRCINTMHDEHGRHDYVDAIQSAVSV
jgi:hypothetical protein